VSHHYLRVATRRPSSLGGIVTRRVKEALHSPAGCKPRAGGRHDGRAVDRLASSPTSPWIHPDPGRASPPRSRNGPGPFDVHPRVARSCFPAQPELGRPALAARTGPQTFSSPSCPGALGAWRVTGGDAAQLFMYQILTARLRRTKPTDPPLISSPDPHMLPPLVKPGLRNDATRGLTTDAEAETPRRLRFYREFPQEFSDMRFRAWRA
jgi:hypothetical protein